MTKDPRLPTNVRPEKYVLWFRPNLEAFTFQGKEDVRIHILEPTDRIVLNAAELTIQAAQVTPPSGDALRAVETTLDAAAERATIRFGRKLPAGMATLSIQFIGNLNDRLLGFYRSRYEMPDGTSRLMASTQFEPVDARRAFPCWDEPAFKASFEVTLEVPREDLVVSNMPAASSEDLGDGTKRVRFLETPKMSTYLLAFALGPLEAISATAPGGTKVGVVAAPDKVQHGRWALGSGVRILDFLNGYYGIPFPLSKLDHIALPDFAAGAMENWGAITYRERALLHDPATSSAFTRQAIVDIMAHETAHMWFGDLVTMAWWDDLWLNESFASWMGTKTVDALHPDWQMWTQFLYQDTTRALALDGLKSSHPIEVRVRDPSEIKEIFDEVSYSKGASSIRMLEQFLGEEPFRQGLRAYLQAHAYANARTSDLWDALEASSGQPVRALMDTWLTQTGYPLVEAEVKRSKGEATVTLRQSRFVYEHILGASDDPTLWKVPVHILRAGASSPSRLLLEGRSASHTLGQGAKSAAADWIKVNAGQSGFYRVNYPAKEWERLRGGVKRGELPPRDRLGLEHDAYALMLAGYAPATTFLSLTQAYRGETDATVWRALAESLHGLETLLVDLPLGDQLDGFGRDLFRSAGDRIGWDARPGEGHLDAILRSTVLSRLGHYGEAAVLREASDRFRAFLKDPASLHPDLRDAVYGLVAQEADEGGYETLWDLERKATLNEEKVRLLQALARVREPKLLRETLERSMDEKEVRSQDTVLVVVGVAASRPRVGRDLAWEFLKDNWKELSRRYAGTGFLLQRLVRVPAAFTRLERAQEVEAFFAAHPVPEGQRTVTQSLERMRTNAAWVQTNADEITRWFEQIS